MKDADMISPKPKLSRRDKKRGLVILDVRGRRRLVVSDMSDEEEERFSARTFEALSRNLKESQCGEY